MVMTRPKLEFCDLASENEKTPYKSSRNKKVINHETARDDPAEKYMKEALERLLALISTLKPNRSCTSLVPPECSGFLGLHGWCFRLEVPVF